MRTITLKFGGSTLNTADNIHRVCQIILSKSENNNCYVVVSAIKGSTERLIDICKATKASVAIANQKLLKLIAEHQQLANTILNIAHARAWSKEVAIYIEAAQKRLQKPVQTDADIASILALGEKLTAALISQALKQKGKNCNWLCSESLIKTTGAILHARLDDKATQQCFSALHKVDY